MTLTFWGLIIYFTFVFLYFLNTLITETSSDDRYQRIKNTLLSNDLFLYSTIHSYVCFI